MVSRQRSLFSHTLEFMRKVRHYKSNYNNIDECFDGDEIQSVMGAYGRSVHRV